MGSRSWISETTSLFDEPTTLLDAPSDLFSPSDDPTQQSDVSTDETDDSTYTDRRSDSCSRCIQVFEPLTASRVPSTSAAEPMTCISRRVDRHLSTDDSARRYVSSDFSNRSLPHSNRRPLTPERSSAPDETLIGRTGSLHRYSRNRHSLARIAHPNLSAAHCPAWCRSLRTVETLIRHVASTTGQIGPLTPARDRFIGNARTSHAAGAERTFDNSHR